MKLCFATNNANKLHEIQSLLGDEFQLLSLKDIECNTDIPEPHPTISENSYEKAQYIWDNYQINCFADDTGLEVFALKKEPGVLSARYAGPQKDANDNMNLLLKNLAKYDNKNARFITIITLVIDGKFKQFEGIVEGQIIGTKKGNHGFGYDPIFVPENQNQTFAEMDMNQKNQFSHRARAFAKLIMYLKETQSQLR